MPSNRGLGFYIVHKYIYIYTHTYAYRVPHVSFCASRILHNPTEAFQAPRPWLNPVTLRDRDLEPAATSES